MLRRWIEIALFFTGWTMPGCGTDLSPKSLRPEPVYTATAMDDGSHLLADPMEDAAMLLGRAVTIEPGVGVRISEALAPGCEVSVTEERAKWSGAFHQRFDEAAGLPAALTALRADRTTAEAPLLLTTTITNQHVLTAELRGLCGDLVIKRVNVGIGSRTLRQPASGKTVPLETPTPETTAALSWEHPRAWAITVSDEAGRAELTIDMPKSVAVWQPFSPTITTADRDLWLIVLACDQEDMCWVLLPNPETPEKRLPAGTSTQLPPLASGAPARERVVAYGFAEEIDFRHYAPKDDVLTEMDCTVYANRLYARLKDGEIPSDKWARAIFRYEVVDQAYE